ncbi:MAG: phage tail protein, partial [Desulfovibrionaceae bacterium]|nr:phage tail protein [Desulfovibrionaceae bacterium]
MKRLPIFFVFCLMLQLVAAGTVLAGDATGFDPTRVAVVAKGAGGVPVGTIVAWPVAKNPEDMDNWLECNGQTVNATVPDTRAGRDNTPREKDFYGVDI